MKIGQIDSLSEENANVLAALIVDPATSDHVRIAILNKLMEIRQDRSFFETVFEDKLSFGACPHCGHEEHWAVPEEALNQLGYVTADHDRNVPRQATEETCPEFKEACMKRKLNP